LGADSAGKCNLSAGITLAEHMTRGLPAVASREQLRTRARATPSDRSWIVFELVDGPPDAPRAGETVDAFNELILSLETPEAPPTHRWEPGS
jgi:hypothetical protein